MGSTRLETNTLRDNKKRTHKIQFTKSSFILFKWLFILPVSISFFCTFHFIAGRNHKTWTVKTFYTCYFWRLLFLVSNFFISILWNSKLAMHSTRVAWRVPKHIKFLNSLQFQLFNEISLFGCVPFLIHIPTLYLCCVSMFAATHFRSSCRKVRRGQMNLLLLHLNNAIFVSFYLHFGALLYWDHFGGNSKKNNLQKGGKQRRGRH